MKSLYEEINGSYIEVGDVNVPTVVSIDTNYGIFLQCQCNAGYRYKS